MYTMWQGQQSYLHDGMLPPPPPQQLMMMQHPHYPHHHHQYHQAYQLNPCDDGSTVRAYQQQQYEQQLQYQQQRQLQRQYKRQSRGGSAASAAEAAPPAAAAVEPQSSNPRASRNQAEKQRRDNLNTQISLMATLVPTVLSGGSRKKDKISILRLTAAYLRQFQTLGASSKQFLPERFNDINIESCLIDSIAESTSFLIVMSTVGKIIYISTHVEKYLGHEQTDLIGDTIFSYVNQEDHYALLTALQPDLSALGFVNSDSLEEGSNSSDDSICRPELMNFEPQRRSVIVRIAQRTNSRRENPHYEYVQISGVLRLSNESRSQEAAAAASASVRSRRECDPKKDIIFVGTGKLLKLKTVTEVSLLDTSKNEYCTRHLVDGRIIFCDHRISFIAGYLSEEVNGTSAFKFMHKDDVKWIMVATKLMFDHGNHGSSCYRLITKTGEFIYLRTHGYLEYDEKTQRVLSFICINSLTSPDEGEKLIADMKKRFAATTDEAVLKITKLNLSDVEIKEESLTNPNLADPEQLEEALTNIMDYQPSVLPDGRKSPDPLPNAQYAKAAMYSQRLPPAELQANQIGIKNVEDVWPGKSGKGKGKGKRSPAERNEEPKVIDRRNGERQIAEKRIPELEDVASPVATSTLSTIKIEKAFTSPRNDVEDYSHVIDEPLGIQSINTNDTMTCVNPSSLSSPYGVQSAIVNDCSDTEIISDSNLLRINLKRPYDDGEEEEEEDNILSKKKSNNFLMTGLMADSEYKPNTNKEYDFNSMENDYIVQPTPLDNCLDDGQSYQQLDTSTISISSKNSFTEFQEYSDEQMLNNEMENNQEIAKLLLKNLQSPIILEEVGNEVHQYQNSDQGAVVENNMNSARVQIPNSMSSCESQFSDIDDSNTDG